MAYISSHQPADKFRGFDAVRHISIPPRLKRRSRTQKNAEYRVRPINHRLTDHEVRNPVAPAERSETAAKKAQTNMLSRPASPDLQGALRAPMDGHEEHMRSPPPPFSMTTQRNAKQQEALNLLDSSKL